MESSPENCLPEAHSLPDGFVETLAEPPPSTAAAAADYKDALLDLEPSIEFDRPASSRISAEIVKLDPLADGLDKLAVSADSLAQEKILSARDDPPERSAETSTKDSSSSEWKSQVGSKIPERDTKAHLELSSSTQKETTEAKQKVVKRSTKSEKELLEFTWKYQKVLAERDAAIAVRERLESLCRELQRQNKMLMDECQRVSTEGQNMRSNLSTKFNDAIKDISKKLEEQKDECISQLKENDMLRDKLKHLADQYTLSEQKFAQKIKQKTLELQLADLKLQQQEEKAAQEQTKMQMYAEQVSQLMATEKSLRLQLTADGERFHQFQEALTKSNEVFEAFKQEMEKMAKLIKELKKENEFVKSKSEKSDIALVKFVEERELMKKQLEKAKNQKEKLESMCRSLQVERKNSSLFTPSLLPLWIARLISPLFSSFFFFLLSFVK